MTTDLDPPYTDAEIRAARQQIQMRRLAEAAEGFTRAVHESVARSAEQLAARIRAAEEAAAERRRRIDAAEQWLLAQEADQP